MKRSTLACNIAGRREPASMSHCPIAAFRLPVTGSSAMPPPRQERTRGLQKHTLVVAAAHRSRQLFRADPPPRHQVRRVPQRRGELTELVQRTATSRRASSVHCRTKHDAKYRLVEFPRPRAIRSTSSGGSGPCLRSGGAANDSRSPSRRIFTSPTSHLLHHVVALRSSTRQKPDMTSSQRRMTSKRKLATGTEDAHPIVCIRMGGGKGTSLPTSWSNL